MLKLIKERYMIFERIKMFIEAANRQNIAKTADTFHTTKDRIRNQIILLEKEIGYPLFVKTPKGSYLNKDGEIIYHYPMPENEVDALFQ